MKNLRLTIHSVIVIILAIIATVMLPCEFFWRSTTLEIMEEAAFPGILLWIFYITFVLTIICTVFGRKDFATLSGVINAIMIILAVLIMIIERRDGDIFFYLDFGSYVCTICSIAAVITVAKMKS